MSLVLTRKQADSLLRFVEERVGQNGCDHSLRFAHEWASDAGFDHDDLIDILEDNGCYCDCEVVLNLPEERDVSFHSPEVGPSAENPWAIPPAFTAAPTDSFEKVLVCDPDGSHNAHALAGEILVPAPCGAKPRKRTRRSMHFFIGLPSGLPAEVGIVKAWSPVTAEAFAGRVVESGIEEFAAFTYREAAFVLSRLVSLKQGMDVGTHFMEIVGEKRFELRVHKLFSRK